MQEFFINNWDTVIVLIGGVISFLWGVKQFYLTREQGVEIEKLKTQLELEKNQKLLNDKKFRKAYEDFIGMLMDMILNGKNTINKELKEKMAEFNKALMLFAGPKTIKIYSEYKKGVNKGDSNVLQHLGKILLNMRKDLGVSNGDNAYYLTENDILQPLCNDNLDEMIKNTL